MLSLKDCMAMADIPEDKLLELARREHLPVMLAVALAAQRRGELRPGKTGTAVPVLPDNHGADRKTRAYRPLG